MIWQIQFNHFTSIDLMKLILILLLSVCVAALTLGLRAQSIPISTEEDLKTELAKAPCKDEERQAAVKEVFGRVGTAPEAVVTQKIGKIENITVTKPGKTKETIIVGAHYDKTPT